MSDGDDNILKLVDAETPPPDDGYRLQDQIGFILRRANQRRAKRLNVVAEVAMAFGEQENGAIA